MKGRIALVTGASRGIGQAIAIELAAAGATVAGTATTAGGAAAIGEALRAAGVGGEGFVLDVRDPASAEAMLGEIQARLGDVSILVNNAGITRDNLLLRLRNEDWDEVLDTNLKSAFSLSKLVLRPMMKQRWGRIINVTSVVGHSGNAGQTNYAASKAGLIGFSKSLAREVASRNITVNCIAPGFIDTDMTRGLADAQRDALLAQIPLARFGEAKEVAAAAAYLASEGAGYVTGSTIHVNGGMFME
ncbi:MAG: 3-oxoacyl-ACP reductase FabG [Vicinamibacterales bacterium]